VDSVARLSGVLAVGLLILGTVVGSFWLAQADVMMTAPPSIGSFVLPTPTPYPADPPREPVLAYPTPTEIVLLQPESGTAVPTDAPDGVCEAIPEGWVYYLVRLGDTFESLAARGGVALSELLQGNCKARSYRLEVGEALYVPQKILIEPTATPFICVRPPGWQTISVQPGDTFFSIAYRYGIELPLLLAINCRTASQSDLYVGEAIYVPWRALPPTPRPTLIWPTATHFPPTPTATLTPTPTSTPTQTPIPSPTPTPTETPVRVPTWTATPPEWELPTAGPPPTGTPADLTPTPTSEISPTVVPEPTATLTVAPTDGPSPEPTQGTPTSSPEAPTPTHTPEPTATETAETASPTAEPTAEGAGTPSASATPSPAP
jgi:LysM repeat protein